jgi:hypothetical protein
MSTLKIIYGLQQRIFFFSGNTTATVELRLFQLLPACQHLPTDLAVYNRTAVPGSVPSHSYVNEAAAITCPKVWHGSFWDTELLMFHDLDSAASSLCFNHFHATQKNVLLIGSDPATFPVLDKRFSFGNFSLAST